MSIHRLEILAGSVRRRKFTQAVKEAIVSETLSGDATVSLGVRSFISGEQRIPARRCLVKPGLTCCCICSTLAIERLNMGLVERENVIAEIGSTCMLMRTRLISRVLTAIYDEGLRPLGVVSPQFALLVIITEIEPATRAEIGRYHHQDRSTLTRNLKIILSEGWVEELQDEKSGRRKPIILTQAGKDLLLKGAPAWRGAQAQAKALLGKDGVVAVMDIANRIMDPKPTA